MRNYKEEYYEELILWNHNFLKISAEKERIKKIIKTIPYNAQTTI